MFSIAFKYRPMPWVPDNRWGRYALSAYRLTLAAVVLLALGVALGTAWLACGKPGIASIERLVGEIADGIFNDDTDSAGV